MRYNIVPQEPAIVFNGRISTLFPRALTISLRRRLCCKKSSFFPLARADTLFQTVLETARDSIPPGVRAEEKRYEMNWEIETRLTRNRWRISGRCRTFLSGGIVATSRVSFAKLSPVRVTGVYCALHDQSNKWGGWNTGIIFPLAFRLLGGAQPSISVRRVTLALCKQI